MITQLILFLAPIAIIVGIIIYIRRKKRHDNIGLTLAVKKT